MRHPRHLILTVLAMLALIVTACAEDDADASGSAGEPTESAGISIDIGSEEPSPSETAEESEEPSGEASFGDDDESASPSFGDDEESASPDDASPSADEGGLTADCAAAFEEVPDLSRIDSLNQLQEALDALDETIEACESVSAWTDEAQEVLNLANIDIDARDFLERQCERSDLEDAPLCEAL